jgi:TubC N-terminal docking domain
MTAATALLARLRDRGITVLADGDRLRLRPGTALTPDDIEAIAAEKAELLRLVRAMSSPAQARGVPLDPITLHEVLGPRPAPKAVSAVRQEILTAIATIEVGIATGALSPRQLVRGRSLADWLSLDYLAQLLRRSSG